MQRSLVSRLRERPVSASSTLPLTSLYVEQFKLHLYNNHCRQIFFGCSHDNGFARTLEEILPEAGSTDRVTLLEGTPFEKELVELPFRTHKIEGLFRSQKINIYQNGIANGNGVADGNGVTKPHLLNPGVAPFPAPLRCVASNNVSHLGLPVTTPANALNRWMAYRAPPQPPPSTPTISLPPPRPL